MISYFKKKLPFNIPYKDALRLMLTSIIRGAIPPYSYVFTIWFLIQQHNLKVRRKIGIFSSVFGVLRKDFRTDTTIYLKF